MILESQGIAIIANEDVIVGMPKLFGDLPMELEHAVFAVGWHEVLRIDERSIKRSSCREGWPESEARKPNCSV
jgi:hypothetical protein